MLFSSPIFFVFFAAYFLAHLAMPRRFRVYLIVAGSTIFYAWWKVDYVWLPYLLMSIAYGGALWMDGAATRAARGRRTAATIIMLFLPLLYFKYTDFVYGDVIGPMIGWRGKLLDVPLPLGVSFVTFTLTAYVVDVYRGKFPARRSAPTVLAYVLFFPHLIAGPILRPAELIPQLEHPRAARLRRPAVPLAIFTLGLVKKLVFADQIADVVNNAYAHPGALGAPEAVLALYGFSVQIYCDFSGYTDMAIGLALLLGVRLPNNFLRPYGAASIVDFWRRWHITLSFWLRDYLYVPLGGGRGGYARQSRNVLITMALGGLWHGASWTFVIWGVLHGIGVVTVHGLKRSRFHEGLGKIPRWLSVLLTFHFVALLWIFFRAGSLDKALAMFAALAGGGWANADAFLIANIFAISLLALFFGLHRFDDHRRIKAMLRRARPEIAWPVIALGWIVAITVSQGSSAKFIYFDF